MEEIWKDIKGFEGYYSVSNLGRVRSEERTIIMKNGNFHHRKERILTPVLNKKLGFYQVMLMIHGRNKLCYVHRLVADAFLDNPNGYNMVSHINGDDTDNRADNLMYISRSRNANKRLRIF